MPHALRPPPCDDAETRRVEQLVAELGYVQKRMALRAQPTPAEIPSARRLGAGRPSSRPTYRPEGDS